jgi:hypothetical protein
MKVLGARLPVGILAGIAGLGLSRGRAFAEDAVTYGYEDYREGRGRITARSQSALVHKDFGTDGSIEIGAVVDAISGASPTGLPAPAGSFQVPLAFLHERRKAWNTDISGRFPGIRLTAGYAASRESEYFSNGWALNSQMDLNEKNTTLLFGMAGRDDHAETFFLSSHPYRRKIVTDGIMGLTQVLSPLSFVTANITFGRETGYLSEQHKLVGKTVEIVPGAFLPLTFVENRPDERNNGILFVNFDRAFPVVHGSLEASYRYYRDTFGVASNAFEMQWFERIGPSLVLRPRIRLYDQTAAKFYHYDLNSTDIVPTFVPSSLGPFYSSDYRLSSMNTMAFGVKVSWTVWSHLGFELAFDRYEMRGRDHVTPKSAYPIAGILTLCSSLTW